jgi:hypothetical protein
VTVAPPRRVARAAQDFSAVLAYTILRAPFFSLRGGPRDIPRGIGLCKIGLR